MAVNEALKGLKAPPLVDGEFNQQSYFDWMDTNQYWPYQLTYEEYKDWIDSRSTLDNSVFARIDQQHLRLTQLRHWFFSVEQRLKEYNDLSDEVLKDYNKRK